MIERYVNDDGVVIDAEVKPDGQRELQVAKVVSLSPFTVELLSNGRQFRLFKRLASIDVPSVAVNDLLLVCRVGQGLIALGEVV